MMNLEKMKQKKSKNRVKKGLLAATTFLCLTTPLLQTQTAYAAENTTPAITIEKPDGWKQGETTIAVTVVNLAQVLGLFSAFLFILVLTFTDEKWQLWIQLAHFVILLTTSVLAAKNYGMIGFAWACLGANTLRVVAVIALGIWKAKPAKKEGE